jgi:hypothetical protein
MASVVSCFLQAPKKATEMIRAVIVIFFIINFFRQLIKV